MSKPVVDDLIMLEKGVHTYDSYLKTEVFVIAPVICLLCDNVRASEILNHRGSRAIKLCRMCMVRCMVCIIIIYEKKYGMNDCANPWFDLSVDLFK